MTTIETYCTVEGGRAANITGDGYAGIVEVHPVRGCRMRYAGPLRVLAGLDLEGIEKRLRDELAARVNGIQEIEQ